MREYWSFYLINTAVGLLLAFVPALYVVFFIGIFLPSLAVGVRRLHDQNRSGWYWLVAFIPLGVLVLLYWATQRGTEGSNDYGPDPTRQDGDQMPQRPGAADDSYGWECGNCGSGVPKEAKLCPNCGESFDESDTIEEPGYEAPVEVVEPPEGTEARRVEPEPTEVAVNDDPEVTKPSRDEGGRNVGSGERKESVVDGVEDDPEVVRLREALDAAEREVEQRLEERRQAAESDLLKAETAKRVSELARELEQAEAKLAQLDEPDLTPSTETPSGETMKLHRKECRCGLLVDMPSRYCPTCQANMANQLFSRSSYLCGNCLQMATESSESCSNCGTVFQE